MSIRVFFLRVLLGWWLIPAFFVIGMPIWILMGGYIEAMNVFRGTADLLWNGEYTD